MTESTFHGTERYEVRRQVGAGAMGLVFEAWDRDNQRHVALKTLKGASGTTSGSNLYRLKKEFRNLAEIHHPNLVTLHELVGMDGQWFIAMELIEGQPFDSWVRGSPSLSGGPLMQTWLSEELRADVTREEPKRSLAPRNASLAPDMTKLRAATTQLLEGVSALHQHGKLHLDLKPSNVLVTESGRVVLVDFGLVYDADRSPSEQSRIDTVIGTAAFLAPEQLIGTPPTTACDMYAVGTMLYLAVTGQLPFDGSLTQVLVQKAHAVSRRPSHIVEGVPRDLDDLVHNLLQKNPDARFAADAALAYLAGKTLITAPKTAEALEILEGRTDALVKLEDAWNAAKRGRAVLVKVSGQSGTGKTLLIRHFLKNIKKHDQLTTISGRCFERESLPFNAFDQAMDALRKKIKALDDYEQTEILPADMGALAGLFPVMQDLVPPDSVPEPGLPPIENTGSGWDQEPRTNANRRPEPKRAAIPKSPEIVRKLGFDALGRLLGALCAKAPLVLFLDDVMWGDADSARLLASLLRSLARKRILVVITWRTEDGAESDFLTTFDAESPRVETRAIELMPWSKDESVKVAASLLGKEVGDPIVDRLATESRGLPFLLAEMVREVQALDNPDEAKVPELDDLLFQRMSSLSADQRDALLAVALCGKPVSTQLISVAARLEDPVSTFTTLRARHLVRTSKTPDGEIIELYHGLIGQGVRENAGAQQQSHMHLRLAEAHERSGAPDPEILLTHQLAGGLVRQAAATAEQAAQKALSGLAFEKAARLYQLALSLWDGGPSRQKALLTGISGALAQAGRPNESAKSWLLLANAAKPPNDALYRQKAAEQLIVSGEVLRGMRELAPSLARASLSDCPHPLLSLPRIAWWRWRRTGQEWKFQRVKEAAVDEERLKQLDLAHFVTIALSLVDPIQSAWYHEQHLALAKRTGEPKRMARALCYELIVRSDAESEHLGKLEKRVRELAAELQDPYVSALLPICLGIVAFLHGRFKTAYRQLRAGSALLSDNVPGAAFEGWIARLFAMRALIYSGEFKLAGELHEAFIREAEERHNRLLLHLLQTDVFVWLRIAQGDNAALTQELSRETLARSSANVDLTWMFLLKAKVQLALFEDNPEKAGKMMGLLTRNDRRILQVGQSFSWLQVNELDGRVGLAAAAAGFKGVSRVTHALTSMAKSNQRVAVPFSSVLRAGLARLGGNEAAQVQHLRDAVTGFERVDMAVHAQLSRRKLAELVGGSEGRQLKAGAEGWLTHQQVKDMDGLTRVLLPGIGPQRALVVTK